MRIGDSKSSSYKRLMARKAGRKRQAIEDMCARLDKIVAQAEQMGHGKTRDSYMARADKVREKLRKLDH